jgi:hypothetical protein
MPFISANNVSVASKCSRFVRRLMGLIPSGAPKAGGRPAHGARTRSRAEVRGFRPSAQRSPSRLVSGIVAGVRGWRGSQVDSHEIHAPSGLSELLQFARRPAPGCRLWTPELCSFAPRVIYRMSRSARGRARPRPVRSCSARRRLKGLPKMKLPPPFRACLAVLAISAASACASAAPRAIEIAGAQAYPESVTAGPDGE